tara:strand:- start:14294 stop:15409 length:1116 start_codon:yes stop_codon:yes gene_type:complete
MPLSAVKPDQYTEQLHDKVAQVTRNLKAFGVPEAQVFESESIAYRMRAEFRMWHEGDRLDYVMFRRDDPKTPVPIDEFPIACTAIQRLMPLLRVALQHNPALRRKLFQVEFLSTLTGDTLVTLAYHRQLDEQWQQEATQLAADLGVSIVGRARKQKTVIGRDYVTEQLTVDGRDYHYQQYEQAFTQPNARVNIKMIEWARAQVAGLPGDLLELYCGNGNFTLPLAEHFDHVIATELAKSSIRAAKANLNSNAIDNVHMIRLSAEEVTQAMDEVRVFRRLAELPKALSDYQLDTLFVDPPRAGMDENTTRMASRFENIVYISCNPASLADNLQILHATHDVRAFALFDQFPYTPHMEAGVFLKKRRTAQDTP